MLITVPDEVKGQMLYLKNTYQSVYDQLLTILQQPANLLWGPSLNYKFKKGQLYVHCSLNQLH